MSTAAQTPGRLFDQINMKMRALSSPSMDQYKFENDLKVVEEMYDRLKEFNADDINKEKKRDDIHFFINEGFDNKLIDIREARIKYRFNADKKAIDTAFNQMKSATNTTGDRCKNLLDTTLKKIEAMANNGKFLERDYAIEYIHQIQEEAEKMKLVVEVKSAREAKIGDGKSYVTHIKSFQNDLRKGVPPNYPANDRYITNVDKTRKIIIQFSDDFRTKFAGNPEAASTLEEIDEALKLYDEVVPPAKKTVMAQKGLNFVKKLI